MPYTKSVYVIIEDNTICTDAGTVFINSNYWKENNIECIHSNILNTINFNNLKTDLIILLGINLNKFKNILNRSKEFNIPTIFLDISIVDKVIKYINIEELPSYIICSNLKIKKRYIDHGIEENKIFICGNPILDKLKESKDIIKDGYILYNISEKVDKEVYFKTLTYLLSTYNKPIILNLVSSTVESFISSIDRSFKKILVNIRKKRINFLNSSSSIIYNIKNADYVISDLSDILIYSILMGKSTCLISNNITEDIELFGLYCSNHEIDLSKLGINLTDNQINYYLTNYLPCKYDNSNIKRISLVNSFVLSLRDSVKIYTNSLNKQFIDSYPQLKDPLFFIKKEVEDSINGVNKI